VRFRAPLIRGNLPMVIAVANAFNGTIYIPADCPAILAACAACGETCFFGVRLAINVPNSFCTMW
jgi:hypothetical protein